MKRARVACLVALAVALLGAETARAATIVWGGGTGAWASASNWIGGVAPTSSDTASFTGWVPMARSGWTLTASVGAGPSNATDGNWGSRWTTGTNAAIGQWYKIDLGSTQTFSRIVLDDTGDGADYPPGYDVYVSTDNSSWSSSIANGAGAVVTTINFAAQTARYIKIQLNAAGTQWWSIRELSVYTTGNTDDTQLARTGWTLSASNNSSTVNNAIDSSLSTRWDTGTNAASGQWFKVDLGAQISIDRVDFSSYTDNNDYPPSWNVQVSTDDSTYSTATSGTGTAAFIRATFTAQTARYVLINCTGAGSYWWSIHDLNVYGTPTGATVSSSTAVGALTLGKGSVTQGSSGALTLSGAYTQTGGTLTGGSSTFSAGGSFSVSGGTFTAGSGNVTVTGAATISGGAVNLGSGTTAFQSTIGVSGGTLTAASGAVTVTGAATINGSATVNAGSSSNFTFSSTLAIGSGTAGTFSAGSAVLTFVGAVTLQSGGVFNGNTGSGTFSAAPTLTSGIFTLADAGSTGRWTFTQSTTFSSGVTLALPSSGGELSLAPTMALTLNGPVTSSVSGSTYPKIDCNGCTSSQGITIAFGATSTLNISGLEIDNSVATGVSIANGATLTSLSRIKFLNNVGGSGSTHLVLTLGAAVLRAPGCFFDGTAAHNVTLYGTSGAPGGALAIFEDRSASVNGVGAGSALDQDGDTNEDNVGDNVSTGPYYGSVVQWVNAAPTDTSGTAVGSPTAAFDWNTYSWYGVYVAYKDATGAGTADVVWKRNDDGSAAYSYSLPQSSGDVIGTPRWDTINEAVAGVDANGNGNMTDTDVHVLYLATTSGHVIKLIDTGSALLAPTSGVWHTDFTDSNVASISSPLSNDGTNLYFGGTDASSNPRFFGVQIAGGANEKTLQKSIGSLSAIVTTPTFRTYGGSLYAFVGSTATSNQAYVYRLNVTSAYVQSNYSGITASVNDGLSMVNDRVYAVTNGGTLHVLDAANFSAGGFTNLAGFPYQTASAKPIAFAPWVDWTTNYAYFGDDGGSVYVVDGSGAAMSGYPYTLLSSIKITASPIYLQGGGVIAIGANDGFLYFIDRRNGSGSPNLFRRYLVTSSGSVSTVAYNANTSAYMVSTSDGTLMFINASDVSDPTPTVQ